jgi:hypothetical protein
LPNRVPQARYILLNFSLMNQFVTAL